MPGQHFIFSDKKSDQVRRHLLFWTVWGIYFISLHLAAPFLSPKDSYFNNIPFTATEGILIFLFLIPVCYITVYLILPIYVKKKQLLKAILWLVFTWVAYYYFYQWIQEHIFPRILTFVVPEKYMPEEPRSAEIRQFMGLLAVFLGGFTNTAFVAGFKYIKQWYLKEQKNIQLQKENAESQLQLLTAQVHPHFLFNTLNNLYALTLQASPTAPAVVLKLSELMSYMLYDSRSDLTSLQQEIRHIKNYIELEQLRYGNRLDVSLNVSGETGQVSIAPLLLIPFVENAFKHGISEETGNVWVTIDIKVKHDWLSVKVENSYNEPLPPTSGDGDKNGIGLQNVTRRLNLMYEYNHELVINKEPGRYSVDLKIKLS